MFFLELSCFFHDPADVGNLISGSCAFSKTSLNIRKFTVHVLLKPGLENFEHYFTSKVFLGAVNVTCPQDITRGGVTKTGFRNGEPGGLPSMGSHRVGHD